MFATKEELSKHLIDAHDGLASDERVSRDPAGTQTVGD